MGFLDIFKSKKGIEMRRIPYQGKENKYARVMYETGVKFLQEDNYKEAFNLFSLCAESGHTSAKYNLALMYRNGMACEYDFIKSIDLFQEAAEAGHEGARKNYDTMMNVLMAEDMDFNDTAYYMASCGDGENSYGMAIFYASIFMQRHLNEYEIKQIIYWVIRLSRSPQGIAFVKKTRIDASSIPTVNEGDLTPNVLYILNAMDLVSQTAVIAGKRPETELNKFNYDTYHELILLNEHLFFPEQ